MNRNMFAVVATIVFGILFYSMTLSYAGKDINAQEKEKLLTLRVQQHNDIMKDGKLRNLYDLYCPQIRDIIKKNPGKDYVKHLSFQYDQMVDDFKMNYKTESITIEGSLGIVISTMTSNFENYKKQNKIYNYWGFIDNNWYLLDYDRTAPAEPWSMDQYKRLIEGKTLD